MIGVGDSVTVVVKVGDDVTILIGTSLAVFRTRIVECSPEEFVCGFLPTFRRRVADEGQTWCRGWDDEDVQALQVVNALNRDRGPGIHFDLNTATPALRGCTFYPGDELPADVSTHDVLYVTNVSESARLRVVGRKVELA